VGLTFGGETSYFDPDMVAGDKKFVFGVGGTILGEVLGVEAEYGQTPGFFTGGGLVTSSRVATFTASVVVALPRRMARYGLRPYFVGGGGVMRPHIEYALVDVVPIVASNLAVFDIGGGATGFVSDRVGLNWDVRHFSTVGNPMDPNMVFNNPPLVEQLSFWRVTTSVVIRFH